MMIKPNYVEPYSVYTREEAVKALGISQASFSKYFAFSAKSKIVYRGVYLNQVVDQILGVKRDYTENIKVKNPIVKSKGNIIQVNNDYQSLTESDISYLVKKTDDGYLASDELTNVVVKSRKRGGSYTRYIMPLVKTWLNSKARPNIILIDINDGARAYRMDQKTKVLSNFMYYAEQNMYAVGDSFDLITEDVKLLDKSQNTPSLMWLPIIGEYGIDVFQKANKLTKADGLVGLLNMIMTVNTESKRSTKIVINDITTNIMTNDDIAKFTEMLFSIGLGMRIETVLVTDKEISNIISNNAHIVDNVKDFPIDKDILTLTHR